MKELGAKLRFYLTYLTKRFLFSWQIETAYVGNVVGELMSTLFYNITYITFLSVLLSKIKLIGNYSFNDMLVLTLMMQVAFYTALTFTYESSNTFVHDVKYGGFDTNLLRPISPLFQIMTSGLRPFSGIFFSVPPLSIYIFLIIKNHALNPTLLQAAVTLFSFGIGILLLHFYRFMFAMISFKAKEAKNIMKMLDFFGDLGGYPYEAYKQPFLTIVLLIAPLLPAAAIPASYLLGKSTTITPLLVQIGLLALFTTICFAMWKRGLRIYESVSS